ncbi:MAG: hypothetical protein WD602_04880 [Actinomycetota bacterium]
MSRGPSVVILALLAAFTGACGGLENAEPTDPVERPKSIDIDHPDRPDELVVRVTVGGGFVPAEYNLTELPMFSLYGDGTIIAPGPQIAIFPAPALPNLQSRRIAEEGIQSILKGALEAGLQGPDRKLTNDRITDAPTTEFTVITEGRTHTASAYALGVDAGPEEDDGDREPEDRRALRQFLEELTSLDQWLPNDQISGEMPFEPEGLRIFTKQSVSEQLEPGLEQPELDWPVSADLAEFGEPYGSIGYRCGVVEGQDLQRILDAAQRANQLTPWVSGGQTFRVLFRPLLPDETGC